MAPKTPLPETRPAAAYAAVKAPRIQPQPPPSLVTPKKASPKKKVNMLVDEADVGVTCSLASRASPRQTRVMANGKRRVLCCQFVECQVGSFAPNRIGLGKHKGWKWYPTKCCGCNRFIREGKQKESDKKDNITRCNTKRTTMMCKNAYNFRDDPCVRCYCFDCRDMVKQIENPNGSPTKAKDAKGRTVRVSSRKRTAANMLNPGERMLRDGRIVPAKHGRKN